MKKPCLGAPTRSNSDFPGGRLQRLRNLLGFSMRDVERATRQIAATKSHQDFIISISRLYDIEHDEIVPSIFRIYSLAIVYHKDVVELLSWYGIEVHNALTGSSDFSPPLTYRVTLPDNLDERPKPGMVPFDFLEKTTVPVGAVADGLKFVPLAYLAQSGKGQYTYAYIGRNDYTMHPMLPPGSFVQVDESRNRIKEGGWASEYERPLYLVETRSGMTCCWCSFQDGYLVLQSHPLSSVPIRFLRTPQEAEIIGEVVGVALRRPDSSVNLSAAVSKLASARPRTPAAQDPEQCLQL